MKLINQNAEFIKQEPGIEGIYKIVELAGRTSYLSWDKMVDVVSIDLGTLPGNIKASDIPDYKLSPQTCIKFLDDNKIKYQIINSSKKFVDMLVESKHTSVLEHGTVYLRVGRYAWDGLFSHIDDYRENPYSNVNSDRNGDYYITTNLRVLQEHGWLDDLKYLCEPTEFHEKRLSVKVVTSRSISHELVRHRSMSFIMESQRYVGYDKGKYGAEITFIEPCWINRLADTEERNPNTGYSDMFTKGNFIESLMDAENAYITARIAGLQPQEAREVLPNATKTTLVITAFESDWREWFAQRLFGKTGEPHPQMKQLAELIKQEFEKAGVLEGIMKYQSKFE